jgi:hypothetical protein
MRTESGVRYEGVGLVRNWWVSFGRMRKLLEFGWCLCFEFLVRLWVSEVMWLKTDKEGDLVYQYMLDFVRMRKLLGMGVYALSYWSFGHSGGFISMERKELQSLVFLSYLAIESDSCDINWGSGYYTCFVNFGNLGISNARAVYSLYCYWRIEITLLFLSLLPWAASNLCYSICGLATTHEVHLYNV